MRIIVSDSSCLIDLRKGSLLEPFLNLPYEILIPDTLFEEELIKFTQEQKCMLLNNGLKVVELPGEAVIRARKVEIAKPALSIHDCLAFALAERHPGCILLSGDGILRTLAIDHGIDVHGILWVIDEMHQAATATAAELYAALSLFENDPTVRLPLRELRAFIKRYNELL
jgi:predicted nucleic acid-binding protein